MNPETPPAAADTGAPAAPAAASAQPAAPAAPATPPAAPAAPAAPADATPSAYKVPDAYKEQAWAQKIKSEEDLWKQLDNTQKLVGKKTVVPDLSKATEAEREEYYAQTRPPSADAYQFNEGTDPELKTMVGQSMFKHGISAAQANAVIADYQKAEQQAMEKLFSKDGMESEMKTSFGDKWQDVAGATARIMKANLSPEEAANLDKLPNPMLGVLYRAVNSIVKSYGIKESDAHTGAAAGANQPADVGKERTALREQIAALPGKPHTAEEKQALIDKLNATYVMKK